MEGLLLSIPSFLLSMEIQRIKRQANQLKKWRNRSVVTPSCFSGNLSAFFSFLFRWRKPQII